MLANWSAKTDDFLEIVFVLCLFLIELQRYKKKRKREREKARKDEWANFPAVDRKTLNARNITRKIPYSFIY